MSVAVIAAKLGPYLPFLLLTASILIGVPLAYRHYRDVRGYDDSTGGSDMLTDLVRGDAASKMTDAEFRRVRELLLTDPRTANGAKARANPPRAKLDGAAAPRPEQSDMEVAPERNGEARENMADTGG
jgi:hypothetical protein